MLLDSVLRKSGNIEDVQSWCYVLEKGLDGVSAGSGGVLSLQYLDSSFLESSFLVGLKELLAAKKKMGEQHLRLARDKGN